MIPKKLPQFLSADATRKLIEHGRNLKQRLILDLMYSFAMRIAELCSLRICDIDEDQLTIRITGKGGKQRIIEVTERQWSLIIDALQVFKPKIYLFEDSYGKPYGTRQVRQMVYNAAEAAMISHCHPHMLRHSKATHMKNNGTDIYDLQQFLGHVNIETTCVYLHTATKHMRSVLEFND